MAKYEAYSEKVAVKYRDDPSAQPLIDHDKWLDDAKLPKKGECMASSGLLIHVLRHCPPQLAACRMTIMSPYLQVTSQVSESQNQQMRMYVNETFRGVMDLLRRFSSFYIARFREG
ncbi:hypothetical protein O6P43_014217 [Quillaja saponaria]|uniref:Uncharacterized protein n=1 Tax=Quillaja saponaria TaxID=32244 RepID=A0AAD7PQE6_QUISA|nr:hypothetical protein O6P43_014217 [Quillaja saponaria]